MCAGAGQSAEDQPSLRTVLVASCLGCLVYSAADYSSRRECYDEEGTRCTAMDDTHLELCKLISNREFIHVPSRSPVVRKSYSLAMLVQGARRLATISQRTAHK